MGLLGLWLFERDGLKYFYFPATRNLETRRVQYQSIQRQASREVFKQYSRKDDPALRAYCRHSAFKGYFLRMDNEWYLEITIIPFIHACASRWWWFL